MDAEQRAALRAKLSFVESRAPVARRRGTPRAARSDDPPPAAEDPPRRGPRPVGDAALGDLTERIDQMHAELLSLKASVGQVSERVGDLSAVVVALADAILGTLTQPLADVPAPSRPPEPSRPSGYGTSAAATSGGHPRPMAVAPAVTEPDLER